LFICPSMFCLSSRAWSSYERALPVRGSRSRQCDTKPAPSVFPTVELEAAAVHLYRPPCDRQSKSRSSHRSRARLVNPVEPVKDVLPVLRSNSRSGVNHVQSRPMDVVLDDHPYVSTFGTVFNGIIDQIDDRLAEHQAVCGGVDRGRCLHRDGLSLFLGEHAQ